MHIPQKIDPVYSIVFAVALLFFSVGTSVTWSSPVLPKLYNNTDGFFDNAITSDEGSWITSCFSLGMGFGAILYGFLSNIMGRKSCVLTIGPLLIVSYMILSFVKIIEAYYVARFLGGIGMSGAQVAMNLYLTEVISKSQRGQLISFTASAAVAGFVYSYSVGPYISLKIFNISLLIYPCLSVILFLIVAVETPHYYMMKGDKDKALKSLMRLRRKNDNVDQEFFEIEQNIMNTQKLELKKMLALNPTKMGFITAFGLLFFQQLTGIYCIQNYGQQIFAMTGSDLDPKICTIVTGVLQFISGFLSSVVMERFPRKTLLYFSAFGMALAEIPLGIFCYLNTHGSDLSSLSFLPLIALSVFILFYNSAFGPLPFILPAEIFPPAIKGFASSIVGLNHALLGFLVAQYFQDLASIIGIGVLFLIFAVSCLLSIPFTKFFVVETRGKSLEAIQNELMNGKI